MFKNNKLIYESLKELTQNYRISQFKNLQVGDLLVIGLIYYDKSYKKSGYLKIALDPLNSNKATWKLDNKETLLVNEKNNGKNWKKGFSLPESLILHKIK